MMFIAQFKTEKEIYGLEQQMAFLVMMVKILPIFRSHLSTVILLLLLIRFQGNIWFSTFDRKNKSREAILYNPSTNKIVHSMSQAEFGDQMITCIEIDKLENVWFGTNKMTLFKYDGKIFTKLSSE